MVTYLIVAQGPKDKKSWIWQGATDNRLEALKQFWNENLDNFPEDNIPEIKHLIKVKPNGKAEKIRFDGKPWQDRSGCGFITINIESQS